MESKNTYGVGWLHLFYRWRVPIGGLMSLLGIAFGYMSGGAGMVGAVLSGMCLIGYIVLYMGYTKGRYFNLYASWMYYLTLTLLWMECIAAFLSYGNNVFGLFGYAVFGICNHIYFHHRRYLCYGVRSKDEEIEKIKEREEE